MHRVQGRADENGDWLRKSRIDAPAQPLLVAVPVPLFISPVQGRILFLAVGSRRHPFNAAAFTRWQGCHVAHRADNAMHELQQPFTFLELL